MNLSKIISKKVYRRVITCTSLFLLIGCTTFSKSAKYNVFSNENQRIKYTNTDLNIEHLTYGGLNIIDSKEKKANNSAVDLKYKNIVYYASQDLGFEVHNVKYDYYLLAKFSEKKNKDAIVKQIRCNSRNYYLVISRDIPVNDLKLLIDSFKCTK